eukprot:TRINITY_DN4470_c0_g1_i8.p1 TRINITY_DN4470_c0_g1~~TRINITY_DN4470_c0_g1_i8.p1  ORF type:complete len:224 (+),score=36.20 TRINITY_DN4470_c0_g1_i8:198-869(+)
MPSSNHLSPHTGTTIVACEYDGGVVLGSDTRVSVPGYITNRASSKSAPLTDNIYILRSGTAADAQAITDYVRHFLEQYKSTMQVEPTVKVAARLVSQLNYNNKNFLMGWLIIAGWDAQLGGQVYSVPVGGSLTREEWTTDGSGSTFIWGYMDSNYRKGMGKEEAKNYVRNAVALAMARDQSSGGCIRLNVISKEGVESEMLQADEVPAFWDEMRVEQVGMIVD